MVKQYLVMAVTFENHFKKGEEKKMPSLHIYGFIPKF